MARFKSVFVALLVAATGTLTVTTGSPAQAADLMNFRVGIQLVDNKGNSGAGVQQFTNFVNFGTSTSNWAGDSNNYDPDGAKIILELASSSLLGKVDFRIGGQARDRNGQTGVVAFTPWASQGGGSSDLITDANSYDPDQYRVILETRPMPANIQISDFRLSILAVDGSAPEGVPAFTRWASQGGGQSPYALDGNSYDPDGFRIGLEVQ